MSSAGPLQGGAAPPDPEPTWPAVDRRKTPDRRARPTRLWDALRGHRKRVSGRRAGEQRDVYVDRYRGRDLALAGAVLLLNLLDAFLTLRLLDRGGSEANPLMDRLLEASHRAFLIEKTLLVGACLLLLLAHKNFRPARVFLGLLFIGYAGLLGYHALLLSLTP